MIASFPKLSRFLADIICIPLIIVLAYCIKFKIGWVFVHFFSIPIGGIYKSAQIEPYLSVIWVIILVWIFTFYLMGVYKQFKGLMPEVDEWIALVKGVSLATLEIMALTFAFKSFPGSRFVIFYSWLLGILILGGIRLCFQQAEKKRLKKGIHLKKTLVVGLDSAGQDIIERMIISPTLGYFYVGSIADSIPDYCHFHLREKLQLLGSPSTIQTVFSTCTFDTVFITSSLPQQTLLEVITLCKTHEKDLKILSNTHQLISGFSSVEDVDGIVFASSSNPKTLYNTSFLKRGFDIVCSACALIALSPIMVSIACYIKLVSPGGPVLYAQERVGLHQKPFNMLKFRTMIPDAESKTGPIMVSEKKETRYIKGGDFLRKTSLDELPQLFNILMGTMSVVGPRPERPFFVNQFTETIPDFPLRHVIKGGLTGWAQVNGRSVLTRNPAHKLRYDLYYIQHWSFSFDIKIILKTLGVVFSREEAY